MCGLGQQTSDIHVGVAVAVPVWEADGAPEGDTINQDEHIRKGAEPVKAVWCFVSYEAPHQ